MYHQVGFSGFIAAHPIALALVTAVAVGAGSYYLGKKMAEKAAQKADAEGAAAPQQEDSGPSTAHAAGMA